MSTFWTPLLYSFPFAWRKTVSLFGGSLNLIFSMISLCFFKRSLLEDRKCVKWTLSLAKDLNKILYIINEMAEAISGWYFECLKAPL